MQSLLEIVVANAVAATALAIVFTPLGMVLRRPAVIHLLWVVVLCKFILPPLARPPVAILEGPADSILTFAGFSAPPEAVDLTAPRRAGVAKNDAEPTAPAPAVTERGGAAWDHRRVEFPTVPALCALSLLGSTIVAVRLYRRSARLCALLAHSAPAPDWIRRITEQACGAVGLSRCPEVLLVPGSISPVVWGLWRPTILLPIPLIDRLGADMLGSVLAHELAHIRRRDHWVRIVELAATVLYWWHPVLWWARRRLHEAEEMACDAWALEAMGADRGRYAHSILDAVDLMASRHNAPSVACHFFGTWPLRRRIEAILSGRGRVRTGTLGWIAVFATAAISLTLVPKLTAQQQSNAALSSDEIEIIDRDLSQEAARLRSGLAGHRQSLEQYLESLHNYRQAADAYPASSPTQKGILRSYASAVESYKSAVLASERMREDLDAKVNRYTQAKAVYQQARSAGANPDELKTYRSRFDAAVSNLRRLLRREISDGVRSRSDMSSPGRAVITSP